jgi:pimeloyl-ACP methyl ester carboxylesterase
MSLAKTIRGPFLLAWTVSLAASGPASAGSRNGVVVIRVNSAELSCPIPYRTGRTPVVFIHGMLGSPANWSVMLEQLAADPSVRAHFQPLVFRYDSLRPIPDAGRELLDALRAARRQFDPGGRDAGFDRVILVGHSMGGLVAKAAIRARDQALPEVDDAWHDGPAVAVPRVDRVIFVATPHRGSPVDRGALRSAGSWIARAISPSSPAWGSRATSVDQLAWDSPLLADLERSRAAEGVPFHSIIAALRDPADEGASDGLVPVASARLDGARSEVVVRTHHICYRHPEVIGEVRRILIEQAAVPEGSRRAELVRPPASAPSPSSAANPTVGPASSRAPGPAGPAPTASRDGA